MPAGPRDGTRFAVYLCPPADSEYYRLGSDLLGYDVRARRVLPLPDDLKAKWQANAGPYGFHLTVVEGFFCAPEALPAIEAEVRACVACLSPAAELSLHQGRVSIWQGGEVLAQVFSASPDLKMLHALLLGRLDRFVSRSPFEDEIARHPERYAAPWQQARMTLLHTPRGLDSYEPHFTLIDPYGGQEAERWRARLDTQLAPWAEQTYRAVTLLVKPGGETHWQVLADISLAD